MKSYRGRIHIECQKGRKPCPRKIKDGNVKPDCCGCEFAQAKVVDLDGGDLFTFPKVVPAKKKSKKKEG